MANIENEDNKEEYDGTMDTPLYTIKAAMATMYQTGGYGLNKDPSFAGKENNIIFVSSGRNYL